MRYNTESMADLQLKKCSKLYCFLLEDAAAVGGWVAERSGVVAVMGLRP